MGRRKGGNKNPAPEGGHKGSSSNGLLDAAIRMSIAGGEEVDEVMEERTESSNLEDPPESLSLIGNDKTSADYYFDSYSHFGNASL